MKEHGILSRGLKAVPFLRHHVQQPRLLLALRHFQVLAEHWNIVTVNRSNVSHSEFFEEHPELPERFREYYRRPGARVLRLLAGPLIALLGVGTLLVASIREHANV